MGVTTISLGPLVPSRLLGWHRVPAHVLSTQPRAARRGISTRTGMSVSGAITAVPRPVPSHASILSHWRARCSVWKAAMHTALRVSQLSCPGSGRVGGRGWALRKGASWWCSTSPRGVLSLSLPPWVLLSGALSSKPGQL